MGPILSAYRYSQRDAGISLVSVLVALGLVVLLGGVVTTLFRNNLTEVKVIEDRQAADELRRYVRIGLSCDATKTGIPAGCRNAYVALQRPSRAGGASPPLVAGPGAAATVVGAYKLRAKCLSSPTEFDVEYAAKASRANDWKSLFKVPLKCPD